MVSSFCANCKREIDTCPQMEYNVANFKVRFQFGEQLHRTTKYVILSGVRSTESKNLRISSTFAVKLAQRSFDSA